VVFTADDRW